jgi:mRNA interferase MazF
MTTMQRGDVVSVADRAGDYTGKPRPAVIVQSDLFGTLDSVTICPLTSVASDSPVVRLEITPSSGLPLDRTSWIAVDKITTVRRNRIGAPLGRLPAPDMQRLTGALAVFLAIG